MSFVSPVSQIVHSLDDYDAALVSSLVSRVAMCCSHQLGGEVGVVEDMVCFCDEKSGMVGVSNPLFGLSGLA